MQSELFSIENRNTSIASAFNKEHSFNSHYPIEILILNDSNVNDVSLEFVINNFRSLKVLQLSNCKFIDDRALANIACLSCLEHLDLSKCYKISSFGLVHLQGLKNLKVLNLSGVKLSDTSIVYFQKFQNLHELNLSRTEITDLALERLLQFPLRFTLAKFFLIGTKITNKGLLLLSEFSCLEYVNVAGSLANSLGVAKLKSEIEKRNQNVICVKIVQGMIIEIQQIHNHLQNSCEKKTHCGDQKLCFVNKQLIQFLEELGNKKTIHKDRIHQDAFLFSSWQQDNNALFFSQSSCFSSALSNCLRSDCNKENISPQICDDHNNFHDNIQLVSNSNSSDKKRQSNSEQEKPQIFQFDFDHSCSHSLMTSSGSVVPELDSSKVSTQPTRTSNSFVHTQKAQHQDLVAIAMELTKSIEEFIKTNNLNNACIKILPKNDTPTSPFKDLISVDRILDKVLGLKRRTKQAKTTKPTNYGSSLECTKRSCPFNDIIFDSGVVQPLKKQKFVE